jgi:hypothetical protein
MNSPKETCPVTMTSKEAAKELAKRGCNYITFCSDLNGIEGCKNDWQAKYMAELETHYIPSEVDGVSGYILGVIIPYHLLHPPKRIQ